MFPKSSDVCAFEGHRRNDDGLERILWIAVHRQHNVGCEFDEFDVQTRVPVPLSNCFDYLKLSGDRSIHILQFMSNITSMTSLFLSLSLFIKKSLLLLAKAGFRTIQTKELPSQILFSELSNNPVLFKLLIATWNSN